MKIECLECGHLNDVQMDAWIQNEKSRHCEKCGDQLFLTSGEWEKR